MATATETPKAQKAHKSKDSSKKSSKKRSHEEQQAVEATTTPSKRQRTDDEDDEDDEDDAVVDPSTTTAATAAADSSEPSEAVVSGLYTPTDAELEQHSPFVQQTTSFYLPLSPVAHRFPLQGLCAEHLSPLLLTYYPPLKGVLLSYTNARLSSTPDNVPATATTKPDSSKDADAAAAALPMAKSIDEYAASFVWLTADFTVLRPARGACIEGHVSLQNESYLGLVCWNFFNAGIDRRRLPRDWRWVGESSKSSNTASDWMRGGKSAAAATAAAESSEGYFVDGEGNRVEGLLRFRVKDYESAPSTDRERGFLSIEGTLLDDAEDAKVDAEDKAKAKGKGKGRRLGGGGRTIAVR